MPEDLVLAVLEDVQQWEPVLPLGKMRLKGVLQMLLEELPLVFEVLDLDLVEEVRHLQPVALEPPRLNAELRHSPSLRAAALSLQELRRAHPQV